MDDTKSAETKGNTDDTKEEEDAVVDLTNAEKVVVDLTKEAVTDKEQLTQAKVDASKKLVGWVRRHLKRKRLLNRIELS